MFKLHTTIVAAALIASLSTANAQYVQTCTRMLNTVMCTTGKLRDTFEKIIQVPRPNTPEEIAEAQAREIQWLEVCKPVPVLDKYGVTRMTYDQACPNGAVIGTGTRPK